MLRRWRASTGRDLDAVFTQCHGKGRLCLPGLRPAHNRPWLYCPARERNMAVRPPDRRHSAAPLVQRGDSMAKPCKGGLTALNCLDDTSCQVWDLVAGCPQSLSRRSPTAPFAQGSRLCCSAYNQPPPVDNKKNSPDGGVFLLSSQFYHPARKRSLAVRPTGPAQKKSLCPR